MEQYTYCSRHAFNNRRRKGELWYALYVFLPIVGGLIACSGLIVKNAPSAQDLLNKLLPYKAFIGVGLLGSFVWNMISWGFNPFVGFSTSLLFGILILAVLTTQLFLGFTMGIGQVIKWIPGDSAPEEKAAALQKKLMPFEVIFGLIAIGSGVLGLLWALKPTMFM